MHKVLEPPTASVILAGGKSSRFGSDKALANLTNIATSSCIDHIHTLLCEFNQKIILSVDKPNKYPQLNSTECIDIFTGNGPLGGILSVMESFPEFSNFLIVSCDMPLINQEVLNRLQNIQENENDITFFSTTKCAHPFPGIYSRRLIPTIKNMMMNKDLSMMQLIASTNLANEIHIDDDRLLINMNTQNDWHTVQSILSKNLNKETPCLCLDPLN